MAIDQAIRGRQAPTCRTLAAELEVSRRTILRDIEFMQNTLGAPVQYDGQRGGYVYDQPNWTMPSIRLTEGDLFAILVAQQALEAYAGTPWAKRLQIVFERIASALPDRINISPKDIPPRLQFDSGASAIVDPDIFDVVQKAITGNQVLRIRYYVLWRAEERRYTVHPYLLRRAQGAWYLVAQTVPGGQVPLFNLSRIRQAAPTGDTFDYDASGFNPQKYFNDTFSVMHSSELHHVAVEFSGIAAQLVRERRWHASQKLKELPRDRLRLEMDVSHLDDVWPWVLSWGAGAKVIAPKELAAEVAGQAAEIVRQHRARKR
jgi:proteasome accessory factor B